MQPCALIRRHALIDLRRSLRYVRDCKWSGVLRSTGIALAVACLVAISQTAPASAAVNDDPNASVPESALALPPPGVSVADPDFGSSIVRLSDASEQGSFESPIYSQLQAFSTDENYVLLDSPDGYRIRQLAGRGLVDIDTSTWNAPRWDPATPHSVLHFDANDNETVVVQRTDVGTGSTSDVFTFPGQFLTVLNNQSFDELSRDGRWMSGMVTSQSGHDTVFVLDLVNRHLTFTKTIDSFYAGACTPDPHWGNVEPDWVGVSPLGRNLVIQWTRDGTSRCSGLETFDLETGAFVGRAYDGHQHGDLGVDSNGTSEFFMTYEMYHPSGLLSIGMRELPGNSTVSPPRYLRVLQWGNEEHISCQGPNGGCLISTAADPSNGWNPFEQELFIQNTDGTVDRLAHTRTSGCGYFAQSRATWSPDARYVIWASDWNRESGDCSDNERVDPMLLVLKGSLPTGAGNGASSPPPPGGVRRLHIVNRRVSAARVGWLAPATGQLGLSYEIMVARHGRTVRSWSNTGTSSQSLIRGLVRTKDYTVFVRATNVSGQGPSARITVPAFR